ncbi:hypothetical protein MNO14_06685 [Luteimonas sp. S4-F44]|uniref:hypothetical protein n=1 Tax=Luteimonas sp. S4-F44 TaxID=2925842 RepID=UPI001F530E89|nr:hypothetical protein [Luteimonas sp. S4-F44]UNK43740.1 hypothetical protein MNO14_06685 [Luteimonas sp. S4-F44]
MSTRAKAIQPCPPDNARGVKPLPDGHAQAIALTSTASRPPLIERGMTSNDTRVQALPKCFDNLRPCGRAAGICLGDPVDVDIDSIEFVLRIDERRIRIDMSPISKKSNANLANAAKISVDRFNIKGCKVHFSPMEISCGIYYALMSWQHGMIVRRHRVLRATL